MENTNPTKQTIETSAFPPELKQRLLAVLPLLERLTASGLVSEVSRGDSLLIAEKITVLWERFGKILNGLKNRDKAAKDEFSKLFAEARDSLNDESKVFALNLMLDVRPIATREGSGFSPEEARQIVEFETAMFRYLSKDEIGFLLEHGLLFALSHTNVLKELQIAAVDQNWDEDIGAFKGFADILVRSREGLGAAAGKSISAWIQDFVKSNATMPSKMNSLHLAEFLVKNSGTNGLKPEEKLTLSDILNLYLWFLNPKFDEQELNQYRREIEEQKRKYIEDLFAASEAGRESSMPKYFWPARDAKKTYSPAPAAVAVPRLETRPISPPVVPVVKKPLSMPPPPAPAVQPSPMPAPQTLRPSAPRATSLNEDLYRKTLEELNKMREEEKPAKTFEKSLGGQAAPISKPKPLPPVSPPPVSMPPPVRKAAPPPQVQTWPVTEVQKIVEQELAKTNEPYTPEPSPFSVNDALARAGLKKGINDKNAEVVPGIQKDSDDELERSLKEIEDEHGK